MKQSAWTKREMLISFRALANAIDITVIPERIEQHLKEIEAMARIVRKKELHRSPYWLNN